MNTFSVDLRERILAAYDAGLGTRQQIAGQFMVSLGMVKKLLAQRKATGDIAPRHGTGRPPKITADHRQRLEQLVKEQPDRTLTELRDALGLDCTTPAIHYVLKSMGLSYKKRVSAPVSRIVPTSRSNAMPGIKSRNSKTRVA